MEHESTNITTNAVTNAAKQLFLEQALAYYRDMKSVADNAPDGHAIRLTETFAVTQGRELVRKSLAMILQEQIDDHQKKRNTTLPQMPNQNKTSRR